MPECSVCGQVFEAYRLAGGKCPHCFSLEFQTALDTECKAIAQRLNTISIHLNEIDRSPENPESLWACIEQQWIHIDHSIRNIAQLRKSVSGPIPLSAAEDCPDKVPK